MGARGSRWRRVTARSAAASGCSACATSPGCPTDASCAPSPPAASTGWPAAAADGTPPAVLDVPFTHISQVVAGPAGSVLVVAGTATDDKRALPRATLADDPAEPPAIERLRPVRDLGLGNDPAAWFSVPEAIVVPTTGDATAQARPVCPHNPDVAAPPARSGSLLLVLGHGGPTSAACAQLNRGSSSGRAGASPCSTPNYRGSTGYGRPSARRRVRWGSSTSTTASAAARLAEVGQVEPAPLAIRGGSAGGFTTLAALRSRTVHGGRSHSASLIPTARARHAQVESRYLDVWSAPAPPSGHLRARSPIHHTDGLRPAADLFQGLDDEVVPPAGPRWSPRFPLSWPGFRARGRR